jgi:dihydroxyacetone kinase-like predicted kinase
VENVLRSLKEESLRAARGNSGLILSQFVAGLVDAYLARNEAHVDRLPEILQEGVKQAYQAVLKPKEGTILTVMKAAVYGTARAAAGTVGLGKAAAATTAAATAAAATATEQKTLAGMLDLALSEGLEALKRTPTMLPVLAEAGVVDAGGCGFLYLLEGFVRAMRSEPSRGKSGLDITPVLPEGSAHRTEDPWRSPLTHRYCVQLSLRLRKADTGGIKAILEELGSDAVIASQDSSLRVHLHTDEPHAVLDRLSSLGKVEAPLIDDLASQQQMVLERRVKNPPRIGVVAVVHGEGWQKLFATLGALPIAIRGKNLSVKQILVGVESSPGETVVLLPNDAGFFEACKKTAGVSPKTVHIVPTKAPPEGLSAMMAFDSDGEIEQNLDDMGQAARQVRAGRVTRAAGKVDGVSLTGDPWVGTSLGGIRLTGDTPEQAAQRLVESMVWDDASIISLYRGEGVSLEAAEQLVAYFEEKMPGVELQIYYGGQSRCPYIVGVE